MKNLFALLTLCSLTIANAEPVLIGLDAGTQLAVLCDEAGNSSGWKSEGSMIFDRYVLAEINPVYVVLTNSHGIELRLLLPKSTTKQFQGSEEDYGTPITMPIVVIQQYTFTLTQKFKPEVIKRMCAEIAQLLSSPSMVSYNKEYNRIEYYASPQAKAWVEGYLTVRDA